MLNNTLDGEDSELPDIVRMSIEICEDRKAVDVVAYNVDAISVMASFYVICTGTSVAHIRAICNNLDQRLKSGAGRLPRSVEGKPTSNWVLMDYTDMIIHVFHPDTRNHYDLPSLMGGSTVVYAGSTHDSVVALPETSTSG